MRTVITMAALSALPVPAPAQVESTDQPAHLDFALRIARTRTMLEGAKGRDETAEKGPQERTSRWRVALRPNSVRMLDLDTSVETVIDREQELLIFLDHGEKRFRTRALLGWIAGLDREHAHRQSLAEILPDTIGEDAARPFATFWLESLFRHGEEAASEVEFAERDGGLVCTRGEETVLTTTPGGPELPAPLREVYGVFLIRMFHLHPAIRARLVAADALPGKVRFRSYDTLHYTDTVLEISPWPPADEEPPKTMAPEAAMSTYSAWVDPTDPLDVFFDDLAAERIDAVQTTREEYVARVEERVEAGRHLDAFLVLLEATYSYPNFPARELASGIDLQSEDAAPLRAFMRPRKTDEEHTAAIEAMRAIPRDDLQGATTLDILTATALGSLERYGESEKLFLEILRAKPWLVGPFVDLGHTYAERFEMARAWRCWEYAYQLAPKHRMIRRFSEQQTRLREKYAAWL